MPGDAGPGAAHGALLPGLLDLPPRRPAMPAGDQVTPEQRVDQLAARVREALPTGIDQRALLNFLIGWLVDDPEFNAAVDTYLAMAAKPEKVTR